LGLSPDAKAETFDAPSGDAVTGITGTYVTSLYWAGIKDLDVAGEYVYCAMGLGLGVVQRGHSASPDWLSQTHIPSGAKQIRVVDNRAYVTTGGGVSVFDISDPANPIIMGQINLGPNVSGLEVGGGLLYLSDSWHREVYVVDASNPNELSLSGHYNTYFEPGPMSLKDDSLLFVAVRHSGLHILNVSNPDSIVEVSFYDGYWAGDVVVRDTLAFFSVANEGVHIVDFANLAAPRLLATVSGNSWERLTLAGNHLFATYGWDEVRVIDISDPTNPVVEAVFDVPPPHDAWHPIEVRVDGANAYVADANFGVWTFDVSDPSAPLQTGSLDLSYDATGVVIDGDVAYVPSSHSGLKILNVSIPSSPTLVDTVGELQGMGSLVIRGDLMYVTGKGLRLLNIENRLAPNLVSSYDTLVSYRRVFPTDSLVYATKSSGHDSLEIVSFAEPTNPQRVGQYTDVYFDAAHLGVWGHYAYTGDRWDGRNYWYVDVGVINVADPARSSKVKPYFFGERAFAFRVADGFGYAIVDDYFQVFDLRYPDGIPRHASSVPIFEAASVFIQGDNAYIGTSVGDVYVVDISDRFHAKLLGGFDTDARYVGDIAAVGSYLYIETEYGLQIYQLSEVVSVDDGGKRPVSHQFLVNYPNPFNTGTTIEFDLERPTVVTLSVYNVLGHRVATLQSSLMSAGQHKVKWDGRMTSGKEAPSGLYFCRLVTSERSATKKMLLLR
jgi:hypothetical protein